MPGAGSHLGYGTRAARISAGSYPVPGPSGHRVRLSQVETTTGGVTVPGVAPNDVYAVVSDVTRTGEWSPENVGGRWVGGASGPAVGARFVGSNRRGWARWSTTCRVTDAEPGRRFAFEVTWTVFPVARWDYEFSAADGGTEVRLTWTDRRDGVRGRILSVGGRVLTGTNRDATVIGKNIARSLANLSDVLTGVRDLA